MRDRTKRRRAGAALVVAASTALALSACGGSNNAQSLLKQTFSGQHTINSGSLNFSVSVNPSGSKTLNTPINLSFGGPFQSLGKGKLPQSNFTINISALGKSGSIGLLSTGSNGYVTLQGTSYQLPQASFQRLESNFSSLTSSSGSGSGQNQSALAKLGINPLRWLKDPNVVGNEDVGGTQTTHIKATVDVPALLSDVNTLLQKASSVSGNTKVPSSIPDSTRNRIASEIKNPSFDLWTGTSDKTIRKLAVNLTLPVTGQLSSMLGGLRSAGVGVSMQYANLNQPQTIQAPTSVRPYSEFTSKLRNVISSLQSVVPGASSAGGGAGSSSSSSGAGAGGSSSSSGGAPATGGANIQAYSQCIQSAGQDISKMQRCASLLNGK